MEGEETKGRWGPGRNRSRFATVPGPHSAPRFRRIGDVGARRWSPVGDNQVCCPSAILVTLLPFDAQ